MRSSCKRHKLINIGCGNCWRRQKALQRAMKAAMWYWYYRLPLPAKEMRHLKKWDLKEWKKIKEDLK